VCLLWWCVCYLCCVSLSRPLSVCVVSWLLCSSFLGMCVPGLFLLCVSLRVPCVSYVCRLLFFSVCASHVCVVGGCVLGMCLRVLFFLFSFFFCVVVCKPRVLCVVLGLWRFVFGGLLGGFGVWGCWFLGVAGVGVVLWAILLLLFLLLFFCLECGFGGCWAWCCCW